MTIEVNGPLFALLRMGAVTLGLLQVKTLDTWPAQFRNNLHIEFSTDDLDTLHDAFQANGFEFYQPPTDKPWERNMAVRDPDGYRVEFAQGNRGQNVPEPKS